MCLYAHAYMHMHMVGKNNVVVMVDNGRDC